MFKKSSLVSVLGTIGTILGLVAPLISEWARDKEIETIIEEKVNESICSERK